MTETKVYEIGKLMRASINGFVAGCSIEEYQIPAFGDLVRTAISADLSLFGVIYDISMQDDGMVKQLASSKDVPDYVVQDNLQNRIIPIEISILSLGYQQGEEIRHLLPPRPPYSLNKIYLCTEAEILGFTGEIQFGYLRHFLRNPDLPIGELLAVHVEKTQAAHTAAGNTNWREKAIGEIITMLRDDYPTLMGVLGALSDTRTAA